MTPVGAVSSVPNYFGGWQSAILRPVQAAVSASSTPAKLRAILATLLALSLAWVAIAAWTVAVRTSAADNVVAVSEPLSLDAQQLYRALSDADATEAAAFLSGGLEPLALRTRYEADIARAARRLEAATAAAAQSAATRSRLATLSTALPVYAGLVETARADNRLGLPLGAAYLREASGLMRAALLPAARDLYAQENAQLAAADRQATALPYAALAVAVIVLIVLLGSQRWLARRTKRILNPGPLVATVAMLATLIWLVTALSVARGQLASASDRGSAPAEAMASADIAALQAHADESLTLIDRSGDDSFQQDFALLAERLGPGRGSLLAEAALAAKGSQGAAPAAAAVRVAPAWFSTHQRVRALDDGGSYTAAVRLAIGNGSGDSAVLFGRLDTDLTGAIGADQASFRSAALAGRDALAGLEAGMVALGLLMAAGCIWGISRRLADYR